MPPSGGTLRLKSKLALMSELAAFHWSGAFRKSPLASWHAEQARSIEDRWSRLAVPWLALAIPATPGPRMRQNGLSGSKLGKIEAQYQLPKRSKVPRPL